MTTAAMYVVAGRPWLSAAPHVFEQAFGTYGEARDRQRVLELRGKDVRILRRDCGEGRPVRMSQAFGNQFQYQHAAARGRILNVGCDADTSRLKADRGAVNVDIWNRNPWTGMDCPADVIADARELPAELYGRFDTVVLGDILEHFEDEGDVTLALEQAKRCLDPKGERLIVITCPEDRRPVSDQVSADDPHYLAAGESVGEAPASASRFGGGVRAYHAYPVTRDMVEGWCADAGLEVVGYDWIAYEFCLPDGGHGVTAKAAAGDVGPPAAVSDDEREEADDDGD